jgi:cytochrome c oxidase subunit 3/cytochrome c oxidase subunit I+III
VSTSSFSASSPTATGAPGAARSKTDALVREVPGRRRRPGWWGMVMFLAADSSMFASMIAAYYYIWFVSSAARSWPPPGDPLPKLLKASILTGLMVFSVIPMAVADRGLRRGARPRMFLGGAIVALFGAAFVVLEVFEFMDELKTSKPSSDAYGSIFYTLLGFHLAHIMVLVLFMLLLVVATVTGRLDRQHHVIVRNYALFWYASVVIWCAIYITLYWSLRA